MSTASPASRLREVIPQVFGRGGVRVSISAGVVLIALSALAAYVLPKSPRNPLWETSAWGMFVIVSFIGWGSLLRFVVAKKEEVDLGLRAAWGASVVCFIGGSLMSFALMTRGMALALVQVGILFAVVSLVRERVAFHQRLRVHRRMARLEPRLILLGAIVVFVVGIHYLAGVSDWHTNPYDDDIAYLAFVKKLRDTGTVIEPFSFRRLSALGGQTLFLELISLRASPSEANAFDRGVCLVMIAMIIAGYRRGRRRISLLFALLTVMFIVTLPNVAINTASYYSGIVFFLGIFRTLSWLSDCDDRGRALSPVRAALPLALTSAAVCTLRQNYLPVPVFILLTSYGAKILLTKDQPWTKRLVEPLLVGAFTLVALLGWFVVSWQSSRTFLYPIVRGTFNQALDLKASGLNIWREIWFQVWTAIDGLPLKTIGLFILAAALLKEKDRRRSVWAFVVGSAAGFTMVVHGFTQSDAGNIGRYAFAFVVSLAIIVLLWSGTIARSEKWGRAHAAAGIALFAALSQLVLSREQLLKPYTTYFHNIEELHYAQPRTRESGPSELITYEELQGTVPAGERLAVLLDEPHYLDFSRNPIWNLDMPGYASLPPGMPFFQGSEKLKEYFKTIGVRYLAFVKPQYSRYHYRREYWIEMLANEQEIWRAFAPYLMDFMDTMTELARTHHRLYDYRGIVVFDLATPEAPAP